MTEYIISGFIAYLFFLIIHFLGKILWAFLNWIADSYITSVYNVVVDGVPMVDYYPVKEFFKIRNEVRKNGRKNNSK